jgi:hypothetical protein
MLTGQTAEFEAVNREIPDVGGHSGAPKLLPERGRLIKTHELYSATYRKAIYAVRDVRDVVLSEHSYQLWNGMYGGKLDDFLTGFLVGRVNGYGFWADHVHSWLDAVDAKKGNVLVIKFEDLRQNTCATLAEISKFLGVKVDARAITNAIQNNSVERMREKEDKARETTFKESRRGLRFVRQGSVGGWRQVLTDEQVQLVERYAMSALVRLGYPLTRMQ